MADGPVTVQVTCLQCKNEFEYQRTGRGRTRSLCRPCVELKRQAKNAAYWRSQGKVKWAAARKLPSHCMACERPLNLAPENRIVRFCSDSQCLSERFRKAGEKYRRKSGSVTRQEYAEKRKVPLPIVPCRQCGTEFKARMSKKGQRQIFCSLTCRHESKRIYESEREKRAAQRHRDGHLTRAEQQEIRAKERERKEAERLAFMSKCIKCNGTVEPDRFRPLTKVGCICQACADQAALESRRKSRRIRKGMDRARMKRARVEPVDPFKVFERDGWRCHLCGCKTPKEKRGTYHPKAPELDHIVPLSKGGEHSYRNTACACRACNAAKSDKILGQPSLLAA